MCTKNLLLVVQRAPVKTIMPRWQREWALGWHLTDKALCVHDLLNPCSTPVRLGITVITPFHGRGIGAERFNDLPSDVQHVKDRARTRPRSPEPHLMFPLSYVFPQDLGGTFRSGPPSLLGQNWASKGQSVLSQALGALTGRPLFTLPGSSLPLAPAGAGLSSKASGSISKREARRPWLCPLTLYAL